MATMATMGWMFDALLLASGVEGRFCCFCDCTQQHLFAQHPIWQAFPIGALLTGHTDAGSRTALVKSTLSNKAIAVARLTAVDFSTDPAPVQTEQDVAAFYCARNAIIGSTWVARRAGM